MTATQPITVGNPTFLVDRLGMDCAPFQYVRELTQNAIEAIAKRRETGWTGEGLIVWDVDWKLVETLGIYKLQISDNGIGMSGPEIEQYINSLSSSGGTQGYSENFGVGAKIAAGKDNPEGLVYKSWTGGTGVMATFWKDPDVGYGLQQLKVGDDFAFYAPISDDLKCEPIDERGTTVTLFGHAFEENTYFRESQKQKWLIQYLNSRYFDLPENVTIKVRDFNNASPAEWPASPAAKMGPGGSQMRTIKGMTSHLSKHAVHCGSVDLADATAHWFLLPEDLNVSGGVWDEKSHVAALFQDELYDVKRLAEARSELMRFGITYGSSRVVLYVEPDTSKLDVVANTARSDLLVSANDAGIPLPWAEWASTFRANLPEEIRLMMDEILSKADTGNYRDELRKKVKEMREFFNISKYRRTRKGNVTVAGEAPGGTTGTTDATRKPPAKSVTNPREDGSINDLYADFIAPDGDSARKGRTDDTIPELVWVSVADGTREEGDLEDRAARYLAESNTILANADFRAYQRVLEVIAESYPLAEPAEIKRIVQGSIGFQLIEAVIGIQGLKGSPEWAADATIAQALSEEGLTAVVMSQYANLSYMKRQVAGITGGRRNHIADRISSGTDSSEVAA